MWNLQHKIWLTAGGSPQEQESVAEARRRLSRLRARLNSELTNAVNAINSSTEARRNSDLLSTKPTASQVLGHSGIQVWRGTDRRFADKILAEFQSGTLQANSPLDALTKASKLYVREDGTAFKHRSLWQNIQNRKAEGK